MSVRALEELISLGNTYQNAVEDRDLVDQEIATLLSRLEPLWARRQVANKAVLDAQTELQKHVGNIALVRRMAQGK